MCFIPTKWRIFLVEIGILNLEIRGLDHQVLNTLQFKDLIVLGIVQFEVKYDKKLSKLWLVQARGVSSNGCKNIFLAWEFPKGSKREMQGMFIRDRIQEMKPMFWLHSISIVRILKKKEKDGVKVEGF